MSLKSILSLDESSPIMPRRKTNAKIKPNTGATTAPIKPPSTPKPAMTHETPTKNFTTARETLVVPKTTNLCNPLRIPCGTGKINKGGIAKIRTNTKN